jgi:hypothetical protein
MVTDEEVEAVLREHIRVDATGLAPAVVGHMVFGFADAAKAVRALLAAEAARKPDDKKPGAMTQGLYVMLRKAVKSALYLADDGLILGDAADYGVEGVIDALVEHHLIDPDPSW